MNARALAILLALGLAGLAPAQAPLAPPPLLLANVLGSGVEPADFLVSEKYDGVRAMWDGKSLRFRGGGQIQAPRWFIERLPGTALDGELWLGRGRFEELSGIVRKLEPSEAEWRQVRYMVFELPEGSGTFAERAGRIQEIVAAADFPQLVAVPQFHVVDRAELRRRLEEVVRGGGEGLMLHRADAPYTTGRSDALLKLKPLLDTEAIVVAHMPGKGKYAGILGALTVQMPDGKRFAIGTGFSDNVRRNPPPLGATITYTYRGLTKNGLPRFASYLRVREEF